MSVRIAVTTFFVFFGCCVNVLILEKLVNSLAGVANLVTFLQFLFISLGSFVFTSHFGRRDSKIPIKDCAWLVILFFISSVCNNYAYNLNVPNTLHIIIKSGSIVANMAMGIVIKGAKYPKLKYISAVFITAGIIMCTLASAKHTSPHQPVEVTPYNFFNWCLGVVLLILALLIGAFMGHLQESLYKRFGKHSNDVLYYTHLLPLPLFIFLYDDLMSAIRTCSESVPVNLPILGDIASAWILLIGNVLTQYCCIRSVYTLTSECSSLTVTLILTLRKFSSLVLSVVFFENVFTLIHWAGSFFVFAGTLLFFNVIKLKTD